MSQLRPSVWVGALVLARCLAIIAFALAALASFTSYGSEVYANRGLYEPVLLALAAASALAASALWLRFRSDKADQSLLLFVAFAVFAALSAPLSVLHTAGPSPAYIPFGALSRLALSVAVIVAVLGVQFPALARLPAWIAAAIVLAVAAGADVAIHSNLGTELYDVGETFLERVEAVGLFANLLALIIVTRTWWRARRPFLIYLIGGVLALTLAGTLFVSSSPWEGQWWAAHLGVFVSAIVVTEGVVAESTRRGRLSEVMDQGGLSKLAEGTVDAMRDGLALHDAEGELVGWNPAAEQITGWPREMAALRVSANLPDGIVELSQGKWVEIRHFAVRQNGYHYQATLFTDVTERKHNEEALRESEERYRSLVEVSPDAVILTDLEGRVHLCNRRAAALHGFESGEELMHTNFFELIAPDDRERAMANAMRTVQQGGIRDVEYRMMRRDGSYFSAEMSASIMRDADGKPQALTAVIRDVTERKRSEETLQRSEEHFRSLTENLSDVILILDSDGTIRYESPSVERVLGHGPEERIGKKVFDYAHPADLPQLVDAFRSAMHVPGSLQTTELRVRHADGSWRDLECVGRISINAVGEAVAIVTARDITERKRTEQALREGEERYRGLVQACPDAVALMDLSGKILLCNQRAAELHGFTAVDDVLGLNGFDFIAPERRDEALASARQTIESGAVTNIEYELLRRDGSRFPGEISASRVLGQDGGAVGLTAVWRDISERQSAQDELRRKGALIELLGAVAEAANQASSIKSALKSTIDRVCAYAGWPVGLAYLQAPDSSGDLISSGIWHIENAERFQHLRAVTDESRFAAGFGLPGRILESGEAEWISDLTSNPELLRGLVPGQLNVRSACAFPVLVGAKVVGVLEFLSDQCVESDEGLLEAMTHIGTQLGRVVERQHAREEIDRVFTLSQDLLCIAGFDGRFRRVNPTFCQTLGYTERELMAIEYLDLVHPDDLNATGAELQRLASGKPTRGFEVRLRTKAGAYRWTQWNATPLASENVIYAHGRDVTDRKRADEALQAATDEIRDLYNAAPCGYHSLDKDGIFVRINDTELEWLGYKRGEVVGKRRISDVLTTESTRTFRRHLHGFRKQGWLSGLELEMVRKDGSTFPVLLSTSAVTDASGEFVMTRSTVFDITERKRSEEDLRESEARAREIINTAYDAFVAVSQTGIIGDWNPQAEATFGWARQEAVGRQFIELLISAGSKALYGESLSRFWRTAEGPVLNKWIELTAVHKDGYEFPIEMTISPVQIGEEYIFNAFIHDISERKQAEEIRSRLAAIVESSEDAIIGTTMQGVITTWNAGAERLFGYPAEQAIGENITILAPPDRLGEVRETLARQQSGERVEPFETVRVAKDGTSVDVSLTVSPILDSDRSIIGVSTIARDVSARRRAEQLARETEELARSNADLEQFAYIASHDLQEPLRMVTGYCDLLQRRYKGRLDADADDFIRFAAEGAQRMQELVRGLLAYSRVGPHGQAFQPVNSLQAFDRAVANLDVAIKESGASIHHGRLPTVLADATQLEHVFQNLIGNAIKFRGEKAPRIDVRARRDGQMWLFSVKDNGIGIEARYAEKVFAIFQRLHGRGKYPGTGLGLAICKKIVERHGGRIWFESEPGQGTTFLFTLPGREQKLTRSSRKGDDANAE